MLKLAPVDFLLLLAYLVYLAVVGWKSRGQQQADEVGFLLAGRRLTLPAFVATLVSTWYGGILGVGEYSFRYGISNWLVFGVPYYLAALLYALFLAKRVRVAEQTSIPDQIERSFGRTPALISAGMVFVMTVPAAYVLMIGVLLQAFFGGPLFLWVILGMAVSALYIAFGGFKAVVQTDLVQFTLMYAGFALLLGFSIHHSGGFHWLVGSLPSSHLSWSGGLPIGAVLVWYLIALQTLVDPGFHQRCSAAKDPAVARRGILVSVALWTVFDALTSFSGLYARAILGPDANPLLSYPLLAAEVLPPGITGLFLLGMLSVILSTVDSFGFLAAQTLGRDLIARQRGQLSRWNVRRVQWGLFGTSILAVAIALWKESVVSIWYEFGSVGTPVLLFPLLASYFPKAPFGGRSVTVSMLAGGAVAAAWTFTGSLETGYLLSLQPIFAGLIASALPLAADFLLRKR